MCSSGCPTQDHKSWGECIRSKGIQWSDVNAHAQTTELNTTIKDYHAARAEGLQPDGVDRASVKRAREITKATGEPYRGDA